MAKYHCGCGYTISFVGFPCPDESHVISDDDLDAITDYGKPRTPINGVEFNRRQRDLIQCPQCKRLHLQDAPGVNHFKTYAMEVPDEPSYVLKLESALAQILWLSHEDPGYVEAHKAARKLLEKE